MTLITAYEFQLEDDMENYRYYTMMGGPIKIKAGVTPHKFECQGKYNPPSENRERSNRKRTVLAILSSTENIIEPDQSKGTVFIIYGNAVDRQ